MLELMSAIVRIPDVTRTSREVRDVPISDIRHRERKTNYFVNWK
jgi:hypothetical protein